MITKIEVNGFKSLQNLELEIQPGLNLLVGPNGAGKTNILQFFEFLSYLTSLDINEAVSKMGGAGNIFHKIGLEEYQKTIECKIWGEFEALYEIIEHVDTETVSDINSFICNFEYSFTIRLSEFRDVFIYSSQIIKLYRKHEIVLQFEHQTEENGKPALLSTPIINNDLFNINKKQHIIPHELNEISLINLLSDIYITNFKNEFSEALIYNIQPSKVREIEDISTLPIIKLDGSGLSATLRNLEKNNKLTFNKIISYLKQANSTIDNLEIFNDPFDNKIRIRVTIKSGDSTSVLPFSAMSDGTLKWLVLVTLFLSVNSNSIFDSIFMIRKYYYFIEEPENYLHPWMQAEIVNLIREQTEGKNIPVLITTHSESLLNHAQPEEMILVDFVNGSTIAKRISNLSEIKEEISNTGFGLGYFYFSNALTYE